MKIAAMALLGLVLLGGCGWGDKPEAPEVDPAAVKAAFVAAMHTRRAGVQTMQDAVVRGDLAAAQAAAKGIRAATVPDSIPDSWRAANTALENALYTVTGAQTLAEAAPGVGAAVMACGDCHTEAGVKVEFPPLAHPDREKGVAAHMTRHRVGLEAMRRSVLGNDEEQWARGAAWLAQGPVEQDELPQKYALDDRAKELEARVHSLGAEAEAAKDRAARGVIYGRLVEACAACHVHTRGGPAAKER